MIDDVQIRVAALAVFEGVCVGHKVAADPVGVDQLLHAGGLVDIVLVGSRDVLNPAHRLVGDTERGKDLVVEIVFAEQQLVDRAEELAGLSALDDPMVVGRGQGHDLAHGKPGERLWRGTLEFGGVLHRADCDDRRLAGHEAWDAVDGPDAAGVGEADRGAGEVVDGQLARPRPPDHVLIGRPELREVHLLCGLDRRYEQLPRAVAFLDVDREAEVDVPRLLDRRLALEFGVRPVHRWHRLDRLDHGEADQMGEGHLPAAAALQVIVDDDPVVDQKLGRDGSY
jgi:hypothetical protein